MTNNNINFPLLMSSQAKSVYLKEEPRTPNSLTKRPIKPFFPCKTGLKWDHHEFIRTQLSKSFRKFIIKGPKYPKTICISQEELTKYGEQGIARQMKRKWAKIAKKIKFTRKLSLEKCFIDFASIPNSWIIQGAKSFSWAKALCLPRMVLSEKLLKNLVLWLKYSKKLKHLSYFGDDNISFTVSQDTVQKYFKKISRQIKILRVQTFQITDRTLNENVFRARSNFAKLIVPLNRFEISGNVYQRCQYKYDIKKISNGSVSHQMFSLEGHFLHIAWLVKENTGTSLASFFHKLHDEIQSSLLPQILLLPKILQICPFEDIFELKLKITKDDCLPLNNIADLMTKFLNLGFFNLKMIDFLLSEAYEFISGIIMALPKLLKFETSLKNTAKSYKFDLSHEEFFGKFMPLLVQSNLEQEFNLNFQLKSPEIILSSRPNLYYIDWYRSVVLKKNWRLTKKNGAIDTFMTESSQHDFDEKGFASKKREKNFYLFLKEFDFAENEKLRIKEIIRKILMENGFIDAEQKIVILEILTSISSINFL